MYSSPALPQLATARDRVPAADIATAAAAESSGTTIFTAAQNSEKPADLSSRIIKVICSSRSSAVAEQLNLRGIAQPLLTIPVASTQLQKA